MSLSTLFMQRMFGNRLESCVARFYAARSALSGFHNSGRSSISVARSPPIEVTFLGKELLIWPALPSVAYCVLKGNQWRTCLSRQTPKFVFLTSGRLPLKYILWVKLALPARGFVLI